MAIKVTHSPAFSYLATSLSISFAIIPGSFRVATERAGLQTELNKRQLIFPVLRRIEVLLARLPAVSLSHIFVLLTKTVRYSIGAL